MLDSKTIKQVEDFVYLKPRSVQEIAVHIGKSWRTADRYVEEIAKEFGTIATRTFRGGTRGALKIVYWGSVEKKSRSVFQELLENQILTYRKKEDFSAFDIFQHVAEKDKKALVVESLEEGSIDLKELAELIQGTRQQLLVFSGNLSIINLKYRNITVFHELESLVKKGVSIKIICRVDIAGRENIERMLSLNFKHGKELVEIRHREQPLRANLFDSKVIRIKEIILPTGKLHELRKKMFVFYTIKDKDWVEWSQRLFWKMFSQSIDARKRMEEIRKIIENRLI